MKARWDLILRPSLIVMLVLLGAFLGVGAGFCTLYIRAVVEPAAKRKEIPGSGEEHR